MTTPKPTPKILRLPAVMEMVGVSKPTVYLWIRQGRFPQPLRIGPKASGWLASELDSWIAERAGARSAN